ncbi:hypothetical protein [Acidomonas methanolica]|uniref:hypothetical protein n=1 Tax=Acidomonas methanolica TaxID=437 RepID=UPI002119C4CB|nr:hypothetical protein [Acidomonas methanolica]MCQ9156637.1 hypothetical protein [Acidomonas methanolica]
MEIGKTERLISQGESEVPGDRIVRPVADSIFLNNPPVFHNRPASSRADDRFHHQRRNMERKLAISAALAYGSHATDHFDIFRTHYLAARTACQD